MEQGDNTYPEIGVSDDVRLIDEPSSTARPPVYRRHKWCLLLSVSFLLILIGHIVAIYFIYFHCNNLNNCITLKVLAYNTWGMPAAFGSKFKTERMQAIAKEVQKGEYDLYLLTELWMEPDHTTIAASVPEGYFMTAFRDLALSDCDGRATPALCSGLSVISKFPFQQKEFQSYTYHGDPLKAWIDGEWLARKGVGRVRLTLSNDVSVDLFITHTAADPDPSHGYNNSYYRIRQVSELVDVYIKHAKADVILLGGDFNAGPDEEEGSPYELIREVMVNCIEEIFYKLNRWLAPEFATYGNKRNTFSNIYSPVLYDYIFHKSNASDILVWTNWFELPFLRTLLSTTGKFISLSDHEAVTSTIHIWNRKNGIKSDV